MIDLYKRIFKKNNIENILNSFLNKNKRGYFIQIGSNNGINNDPLRKFILNNKLRGILIEPVKYIYDNLKLNYHGIDNLIFINAAVADFNGEKEFYRLEKTNDNLPVWYDQLGSFIPEVILKHKTEIPNIEDYIISEKVKCITLEKLTEDSKIEKIDIIHIDTEGYDYEIIKLIDFDAIDPKIIIFEHKHLSKSDHESCLALLKKRAYKIIICGNDTLAKK